MKSFSTLAWLAAMAALFVSSDASAQSRAQYESMVAAHAAANNVPEALVHRVIVRESKYHPNLVGRIRNAHVVQVLEEDIAFLLARGGICSDIGRSV